jgi:hypothetical protein
LRLGLPVVLGLKSIYTSRITNWKG